MDTGEPGLKKKCNFDVEWKMMMKKGQKGREKDVEGKKRRTVVVVEKVSGQLTVFAILSVFSGHEG